MAITTPQAVIPATPNIRYLRRLKDIYDGSNTDISFNDIIVPGYYYNDAGISTQWSYTEGPFSASSMQEDFLLIVTKTYSESFSQDGYIQAIIFYNMQKVFFRMVYVNGSTVSASDWSQILSTGQLNAWEDESTLAGHLTLRVDGNNTTEQIRFIDQANSRIVTIISRSSSIEPFSIFVHNQSNSIYYDRYDLPQCTTSSTTTYKILTTKTAPAVIDFGSITSGTITGGATNTTEFSVTFNKTFSSAPQVFATTTTNTSSGYQIWVNSIKSITTTGCKINVSTSNSSNLTLAAARSINWIAVGS